MSTALPNAPHSVEGRQDVAVVIPTVGRPSLAQLLESLAASTGPVPCQLIVVDDRARPSGALRLGALPARLTGPLRIVHSGGRGPAAARNAGWRAAKTSWVAFLDDDVIVGASWFTDLAGDIENARVDTAGISGVVRVPLPRGRRPTDWERGTAGLAQARWITADMAYRFDVLRQVGGFDERFLRAFREDSDIALRVLDAGYSISQGKRSIEHPVRSAPWHASIGQQRGNADDALMRRLHGRGWAQRAGSPPGRRPRHLAITAAAITGLGALVTRQPRVAALAGAVWATGTAEFAWARIAPGPRTAAEIATMALTSLVIPPLAVGHWLAGVVRHRNQQSWTSGLPGVPTSESGVSSEPLVMPA